MMDSIKRNYKTRTENRKCAIVLQTSLMEYTVADSFQMIIKIMNILHWCPSNNSILLKIQGYVLYFIFLVLLLILIVTSMIFEGKSDNNTQLIYVTITFSYFFKLLPFLTNGQDIKHCIYYFDDPYFAPKNDTERNISNRSVKLCQKISKAYALGVGSCAVIYVFPSVFPDYGLPLKLWLPYDPTWGLMRYYATLAYICGGCVFDVFATALIDPLIGGLAYHATGHLKILKNMVQTIWKLSQDQINKTDGLNLNMVIYNNLIKCIQYHNAILKFVDEFEKCFTWVIFSQFFGISLTTCFCCIGAISVPLVSIDATLYISMIPVVLCQIFFYCYYGTLLFEENDSLVTAIYQSDWYKYDVKCRKLLIILMERSKRPTIVRAGKFIDLTLLTFSKIIKSIYSLIACFK